METKQESAANQSKIGKTAAKNSANKAAVKEVHDHESVAEEASTVVDDASKPFIGEWRRLVSTTNWEKGRIIHEWRSALIAKKAPVTEYSDEEWSRKVGTVTGQHAGRLRRVYDRFGETRDQFNGLFWSHFQAAVDWDDADMWLEGAVQSSWSVSGMRRKRWESMGAVAADEPKDDEVVVAEKDEDVDVSIDSSAKPNDDDKNATNSGDPSDTRSFEGPDFGDEDDAAGPSAAFSDDQATVTKDAGKPNVRPFENLPELPEDLAEAFDLMKLSILRHKSNEWREISLEDTIAILDALKGLVLAPSEETSVSVSA